jgi:hypothetical protein
VSLVRRVECRPNDDGHHEKREDEPTNTAKAHAKSGSTNAHRQRGDAACDLSMERQTDGPLNESAA